jgi:alpha-amylase
LRGAHWRNFFAKYPESNLMHKKMLHLSDKIYKRRRAAKGAKNGLARAYDSLWQGQCNCAYWHGLFGGLYLSHLRQGIYRMLLDAEVELKGAKQEDGTLEVEQTDYDCDGREEVLVSGPLMNVYIQPHYGGGVFELDVLARRANLLNVLTRRPEPYHLKIKAAEKSAETGCESIHDLNRVKEKGLEARIVHDWHLKRMFLDHLLAPDVTLARFARADSGEYGDFVNQPYKLVEAAEHPTGGAEIVLERRGGIHRDGVFSSVTIRKTYHLKKENGRVEYEIEPARDFPGTVRTIFGVELNFTLPDAISPGQQLLVNHSLPAGLAETKEFKDAESLALVDGPGKMKLFFTATEKFNLWTFPIETVSQSESGLERTYQGTSALLWRTLDLKAEQKHKITLEFRLALN